MNTEPSLPLLLVCALKTSGLPKATRPAQTPHLGSPTPGMQPPAPNGHRSRDLLWLLATQPHLGGTKSEQHHGGVSHSLGSSALGCTIAWWSWLPLCQPIALGLVPSHHSIVPGHRVLVLSMLAAAEHLPRCWRAGTGQSRYRDIWICTTAMEIPLGSTARANVSLCWERFSVWMHRWGAPSWRAAWVDGASLPLKEAARPWQH